MQSKDFETLQGWVRYLTLASARDLASCTALCSASNTLAWLRKLDCAPPCTGQCPTDGWLADHGSQHEPGLGAYWVPGFLVQKVVGPSCAHTVGVVRPTSLLGLLSIGLDACSCQ